MACFCTFARMTVKGAPRLARFSAFLEITVRYLQMVRLPVFTAMTGSPLLHSANLTIYLKTVT